MLHRLEELIVSMHGCYGVILCREERLLLVVSVLLPRGCSRLEGGSRGLREWMELVIPATETLTSALMIVQSHIGRCEVVWPCSAEV